MVEIMDWITPTSVTETNSAIEYSNSLLYGFKLYVLELQQHKWFLHFASPSNDEFLWIECAALFPFVKKYLPIKTFETIEITDVFQIDYHVKKYMQCYGVENVRGGTYSNEFLDDAIVSFLETEINANVNNYFNRQDMIDNISKTYNSINTIDELKKQRDYLRDEFVKYTELKQIIKDFSGDNKINRELIDDLEWMYSYITSVVDSISVDKISKTDSNRYKEILNKFKTVRNVFNNVLEKPLKFDNAVHLNHPEFIFDRYFYHSHNYYERMQCVNGAETAFSLFQCFEYMSYSIINRLDEFIFDLSTYDYDYEEKLLNSIEYLENLVA